MIKAIIFDAGGVIVNYSRNGFELQANRLGISTEKLVEFYKLHHKVLGKNELKTSDYCKLFEKSFRIKPKLFIDTWKKAYSEVAVYDKDMMKLVEKLKTKYKVAMLSNIVKVNAGIHKKSGFYKNFCCAVLSCDVGLAKPDKKIFELIIKKLKLNADECVFVDNLEENVLAAKEMGFRTILFADKAKAMAELNKLLN
ncbi:MAG TPA: HAD family phosphatase [Nanoarchaeota archaeon]|nr:HAD family phosphatase [Nanoarchaeota archaeon]